MWEVMLDGLLREMIAAFEPMIPSPVAVTTVASTDVLMTAMSSTPMRSTIEVGALFPSMVDGTEAAAVVSLVANGVQDFVSEVTRRPWPPCGDPSELPSVIVEVVGDGIDVRFQCRACVAGTVVHIPV